MRKNGGSQLARDGQRLVIGPWVHLGWQQKVGDIDFGPEAVSPMPELMKRWYDYWLKGVKNGVDTEPRVRVFVMGANKWRTSNDWPIDGHRVSQGLPAQQRCGKHGLRRRHAGHEKA